MPVSTEKKFLVHPGTLHVHYTWNNSDETLNATTLPESRQYIYYDQEAHQTRDRDAAQYRIPIVEEFVTSLNAQGDPVEPKHASFISIMQYGPGHRYLRETHARGTP